MKKVLSYIALMLGSLIVLSLVAGAIDSRNNEQQADRFLPVTHENSYFHAQKVAETIRSDRQDFIIIDMRHKNDYERGHLPGAINILLNDMLQPENLARLPLSKNIIICCAADHEQKRIIETLRGLGYKAYGIKQACTAGGVDRPLNASLTL